MLPTVAAVVVGGNASLDRRASITATVIGAALLTYVSQLVISLGIQPAMQYVVQALIVIASVSLPDATRWLRAARTMGGSVAQPPRPAVARAAAFPGRRQPAGLRASARAARHPQIFGVVAALKGVSLTLYPGEVHAVVGENGAGKSTLLGIAAGTLRADAGDIIRDGKLIGAPSIQTMRESGYRSPINTRRSRPTSPSSRTSSFSTRPATGRPPSG